MSTKELLMIQGIKIAVQGMTVLQQKQDQIANNLANVNTTGFKSSSLFAKSYEKYLSDEKLRPYANREIKADEVFIDFSEGTMKKTDAPLDLTIKGSGFFSVMTASGIKYTRNGNFSIDPNGYLITNTGNKVLGKKGFIKLESDAPVRFNTDGTVVQNGNDMGTLRISDFKKPYRMLREGSSLFAPKQPNNPAIVSSGFIVKQGYLEGSNSGSVKNMVEMITAYRNYEADQKAIQSQDETLDKAVNSVGKL